MDEGKKILFLREWIPWMGQHSGYDLVCKAVKALRPHYTYRDVWKEQRKYLPMASNIFIRLFIEKSRSSPFYNIDSLLAELQAAAKSLRFHPDIIHTLYVENNLGIMQRRNRKVRSRIIGTSHQPESWWRGTRNLQNIVSDLDALITVSSREASYFESYLPGRVHYIPHGIDTEFFRPLDDQRQKSPDPVRCVFSGIWLRDIGTLVQVVDRVLSQRDNIMFDMIVPLDRRKDENFSRLAKYRQVVWHAGLSDEQLLKVYQNASVLLLPMIDCTANNALLEAMACGLPVISNRVGGMLDYTDDSFADLLPAGDAEGIANAVLRLAENPEELRERGLAARRYAEEHFRWEEVARKTLDLYQKVTA